MINTGHTEEPAKTHTPTTHNRYHTRCQMNSIAFRFSSVSLWPLVSVHEKDVPIHTSALELVHPDSSFVNTVRLLTQRGSTIMWKKLAVIVTSGALALSMSACGEKDDAKSGAKEGTQDTVSAAPEQKKSDAATADMDLDEFLAAYESCVDDYVAFSEKFKESSNPLSLTQEAAELQQKAETFTQEAEKWQVESLSEEELSRLEEVMERCSQKMLTVLDNLNEGAKKMLG